ncbi:hypothetical protein NLU13_0967 [Sarocladium strictum]|uniref:Thioesterase domain-containing protein n=1 Tax=Sarocladium strictum TaxID=5046 RepID=A0AA39GQU4_SARSR|nr:hypothetical protein NLU13_0967 [Sarocladium strictum]
MSSNEDKTPATQIISPSLSLPSSSTTSSPRYDEPLKYFTSKPWCNKLLTQPDTHIFLPQCRNPLTERQDQFFTTTLGAPGGMGHMLCFFAHPASSLRDPKTPITKVHTLYSIGEKLTGISGILHGGVTLAFVDEAMSQVVELNSALGKEGATWTNTSVTGTLECKFLKGIPAEGVLLATAWLEGTERRKSFIRCEVVNEDGEKLASVKSVWVSLLPNL